MINMDCVSVILDVPIPSNTVYNLNAIKLI